MAESRVGNGWAFALAAFPFWGTMLALGLIDVTGSSASVFGAEVDYLSLLQDRTVVAQLWMFWMVGTFVLGLIDTRHLQNRGIALRGWECLLTLLLPPVYFFVRNWKIVTTTGQERPAHGWLYVIWVFAVASNAVFCGLVSADRLVKIAKDCALLIAWVLVVALLWSIGERLYAMFWKRP